MTLPRTVTEDVELELVRATIRGFNAAEASNERVRSWDEERRVPPEVWAALAGLGVPALPVPESFGGAGGGVRISAVVVEELARASPVLSARYILVAMASRLLERFGSEGQKERLLPRLASGEIVLAFGLSEPGAGTDLLALRTSAEETSSGWTVHGQKVYTTMADEAEAIIVLARTGPAEEGHRGRGFSLLLISTDQPSVVIQRLRLMAMRAAATCEVFLDGAEAPSSALIGERGRGFYQLLGSLDEERILGAATGIGIAAAALDDAVRYAQERVAFGRPIGAFQAIQHYVADTAIELEQSRLLVERAASILEAGEDASLAALMAKVSAADTALRATDRGMRILAASGLVQEHPMERYFRDARLQAFSPISNEVARNLVAEKVGLPRS